MSDIQAVKFRLVGALVILAGFACVWWLMLDHEAHRRIKDEQVAIPPQSFSVERFEVEEPKPLNIKPSAEQLALLDLAEEENTAPKKNEEIIKPAELKTVVMDSEPPKPLEAQVVVQEKPAVKPVDKPVGKIESKPVEEKSVSVAPKPANYSALGSDGLPDAWVLQLASVKNKDNAQQLQKKLLASSYPAYVKSVSTSDGVSYRVLVGPKLSRQKADEMSKAIEKEHHIKSMIIKFKAGYEQ